MEENFVDDAVAGMGERNAHNNFIGWAGFDASWSRIVKS